MLCYLNIIRVNYSSKIAHKYVSCRTTWEYRHIFVRVSAALFSNLAKFDCLPRRNDISWSYDTINAKDLIMQYAKFRIYTLKLNRYFWHYEEIPITFEERCTQRNQFLYHYLSVDNV